jgi:hypothetical protein
MRQTLCKLVLTLAWDIDRDGYSVEVLSPKSKEWDNPNSETGEYPLKAEASDILVLIAQEWGTMALDQAKPTTFLAGNSQSCRQYDPMMIDHAGLFREFAETNCTIPAVKAFVDQYWLPYKKPVAPIESIYREIKCMRMAVSSWEKAIKSGNMLLFVSAYNKRFRSLLSQELGLSADPRYASFKISPHDFVDALWLQLGQAAANRTDLKRCLWCPKWFPYGSGTGKRKSGHYCSDKCRKSAWEKQKYRKKERQNNERQHQKAG